MTVPPLLRTTERSTFAECQWRWYQSYVKGLDPKRTPTWSWFGRAIHEALRVRYPDGRKRGSLADVLDAFDAALAGERRRMYTQGSELDEEEVVDARTLGRAMLIGYCKKYGKDSHWQVITGEQPMQIDVPHPKDSSRVLAVYCLTLDLVVWDLVDRCYRVVDHKTRRGFPANGKWGFYDLNRQAGSYLWVVPELLESLGIMVKGETVDGIVFNCLKKTMPDERPVNIKGEALNKDGSVSKVQPAPRYHRHLSRRGPHERVRQYQHVLAEVRQMDLLRQGKLLPTKNTTENCERCMLYEYCTTDEISRRDGQEYAAHMLSQRDPYADHRMDMVERNGIWVHVEAEEE